MSHDVNPPIWSDHGPWSGAVAGLPLPPVPAHVARVVIDSASLQEYARRCTIEWNFQQFPLHRMQLERGWTEGAVWVNNTKEDASEYPVDLVQDVLIDILDSPSSRRDAPAPQDVLPSWPERRLLDEGGDPAATPAVLAMLKEGEDLQRVLEYLDDATHSARHALFAVGDIVLERIARQAPGHAALVRLTNWRTKVSRDVSVERVARMLDAMHRAHI